MTPPTDSREKWERRLAPVMVFLSFVFLFLLGALVHRIEYLFSIEQSDLTELHTGLMVAGLLVLWPLFFVEFIVYTRRRNQGESFWRANRSGIFVCLLPPLRVGSASASAAGVIWVPMLGWRQRD